MELGNDDEEIYARYPRTKPLGSEKYHLKTDKFVSFQSFERFLAKADLYLQIYNEEDTTADLNEAFNRSTIEEISDLTDKNSFITFTTKSSITHPNSIQNISINQDVHPSLDSIQRENNRMSEEKKEENNHTRQNERKLSIDSRETYHPKTNHQKTLLQDHRGYRNNNTKPLNGRGSLTLSEISDISVPDSIYIGMDYDDSIPSDTYFFVNKNIDKNADKNVDKNINRIPMNVMIGEAERVALVAKNHQHIMMNHSSSPKLRIESKQPIEYISNRNRSVSTENSNDTDVIYKFIGQKSKHYANKIPNPIHQTTSIKQKDNLKLNDTQGSELFTYSATFPDDMTSISSVTISAPMSSFLPNISTHNKSDDRNDSRNDSMNISSPFQSLGYASNHLNHNNSIQKPVDKINNPIATISNSPYKAILDLVEDSNTDIRLKQSSETLLQMNKHPAYTDSTSPIKERITNSNTKDNSYSYNYQGKSSDPMILIDSKLHMNDIIPLPKSFIQKDQNKRPRKKPLFMRIMEESAKQEAQEHLEKERKLKEIKWKKSRVNPTQEEIKQHMKWHDEIVHKSAPSNNNDPQSSPQRNNLIVIIDNKKSPYRTPTNVGNKNVINNGAAPKSDDQMNKKKKLDSPQPYLKRKSKRVRFKSKLEMRSQTTDDILLQSTPNQGNDRNNKNGKAMDSPNRSHSVRDSIAQETRSGDDPSSSSPSPSLPLSPMDRNHVSPKPSSKPLSLPSIHSKRKFSNQVPLLPNSNPTSRRGTPDVKVRRQISTHQIDRPASAGLDFDLSMFPHGPDWITNILRERDDEHKMAEIYEQSFAIMLMEYEAGVDLINSV